MRNSVRNAEIKSVSAARGSDDSVTASEMRGASVRLPRSCGNHQLSMTRCSTARTANAPSTSTTTRAIPARDPAISGSNRHSIRPPPAATRATTSTSTIERLSANSASTSRKRRVADTTATGGARSATTNAALPGPVSPSKSAKMSAHAMTMPPTMNHCNCARCTPTARRVRNTSATTAIGVATARQ